MISIVGPLAATVVLMITNSMIRGMGNVFRSGSFQTSQSRT